MRTNKPTSIQVVPTSFAEREPTGAPVGVLRGVWRGVVRGVGVAAIGVVLGVLFLMWFLYVAFVAPTFRAQRAGFAIENKLPESSEAHFEPLVPAP